MIGHLARRGITVPRAKLRASIHRVDPVNTAMRRSVAVRRRVYVASGPNAVWHIDGNHKLIRWRLVIHGGIDGFSRSVVYLACANNNRASTVMQAFLGGVDTYGLPSRIRSDFGGENVDVWTHMVEQHESNSAVITGSSVHNERIERLWRDVTRSVGSVFFDTFRQLEEDGKLDVLNEVDIFCLHWVYLPRVNKFLLQFSESWNNHSLSTERSRTPNQLFIEGLLAQQQPVSQPPQDQQAQQQQPTRAGSSRVEVPSGSFKACGALLNALSSFVHPISFSHDQGISMYSDVVDIVGTHLQSGCNQCTE